MDYTTLAHEFMKNMGQLRKHNSQKQLNDSMHGEAFVLHYISMHDGNVIPSEISKEMGISSARIAATLNSLESKGMITRMIDVSDRRRILVELTSSGKEQVEKHFQEIMEFTTNMLCFLGEHDAKEYVRIMGRLADRSPEDFL
jgi:DNA-binding MarR family transcriptional regulator